MNPRHQDEADAPATQPLPTAEGPIRVLLVEDDPTFQLLVRVDFEDDPTIAVDLQMVTRLRAAEPLLAAGPFDIVLTDLNLPDSSGLDTFLTLAQWGAESPIIVFSNQSDEALAARILRRGAQDYVQKSRLVPGALSRIVRRAIERHQYALALDLRAQQLAESEASVRAIHEVSVDAVVVTDHEGMVQFANPAAGTMFGRDPAQLIGSHFGFPVSADATTEVDIVRRDGSVGVAEMRVVELPWNGRQAHLASLRDITDRKLAADRLQASEERFRFLVDQVVDYAFVMLDGEGRIESWNAGAQRTSGFAAEQVLGQPWDVFFSAADQAAGRPAELLQRARTDGRARGESWFCRQADTRIWVELSLTAIRGESALIGFALVVHDLTERQAAEAQRSLMESRLRNAHKLEAIGQLAAGIAHEINTPAHFIGHNLQFIEDAFDTLRLALERRAAGQPRAGDAALISRLMAEIPHALEDGTLGVQRIASIVGAMKLLAHPGLENDRLPVPSDLNQMVESAIILSQHEWKLVAEMVRDLAPDLPLVPLHTGEISQVLLNLLINAAQAIAEAGSSRPGRIQVTTRRSGEAVELLIADTGNGIPEAVRHRVFEPFFTTKEVGQGTGQGLAHAHAIVVGRHGGEISFECPSGQGTCFRLLLPLAVNPSPRLP